MPSAGDPIVVDDFTEELDDHEDRITVLEGTSEDVQENWPKYRGATPVAQTCGNMTEIAMQFIVSPYNVGGIHPGGPATSTHTIPRTGVYLWTAYALWTTIDTDGIRRLSLRRNDVADMVALNPEGLGGFEVPVNVSCVAFFEAGETVKAISYQESAGVGETSDLLVTGWITANYLGTVPT